MVTGLSNFLDLKSPAAECHNSSGRIFNRRSRVTARGPAGALNYNQNIFSSGAEFDVIRISGVEPCKYPCIVGIEIVSRGRLLNTVTANRAERLSSGRQPKCNWSAEPVKIMHTQCKPRVTDRNVVGINSCVDCG